MALSAQLLLSSCVHDNECYGTVRFNLPVTTRGISQTQAE